MTTLLNIPTIPSIILIYVLLIVSINSIAVSPPSSTPTHTAVPSPMMQRGTILCPMTELSHGPIRYTCSTGQVISEIVKVLDDEDNKCTMGRTYFIEGQNIRVSGGCNAKFVYLYEANVRKVGSLIMTCESWGPESVTECVLPDKLVIERVKIIEYISPKVNCETPVSYKAMNQTVRLDNGCKARFQVFIRYL